MRYIGLEELNRILEEMWKGPFLSNIEKEPEKQTMQEK